MHILVFFLNLIGVSFVFRVKINASRFFGLKLSSVDKPHLCILSKRELAIVSISVRESPIIDVDVEMFLNNFVVRGNVCFISNAQ